MRAENRTAANTDLMYAASIKVRSGNRPEPMQNQYAAEPRKGPAMIKSDVAISAVPANRRAAGLKP
jgi:hypothetical protein